MAKLACSVFSIMLLLFGLAETSKLVKVNLASLTWKDGEEEDCSAAQSERAESSFALMHIQSKRSPFRLPNSTWSNTILDSIKTDIHRYRAITQRGRRLLQAKSHRPLPSKAANYIINLNLVDLEIILYIVVQRAGAGSDSSGLKDDDQPLAYGQASNAQSYIIKVDLGTPRQSFYPIVDTGSDVTWIPCNPCPGCQFNLFQPSQSSTFKRLGCASQQCQDLLANAEATCGNHNCNFTRLYGDGSKGDVVLSSDTLSVGSTSTEDFVFGCAKNVSGSLQSTTGLLGFGRGSVSFVSQTADLYDRTFSYCLPKLGSSAFTGSLRLGKGALSTPVLHFTPFLSNAALPSVYYLGLNGISVGEERVSIPADQLTGQGTIIDTTTVITMLVEPAYNAMRDSFRRQLSNLTVIDSSQVGLDSCYNITSGDEEFPQITLHFDNNLNLALPPENFLLLVDSMLCLAFRSVSVGGNSIIGSYQQQNFRVVYDGAGSRIGIAAENCDD